MKSVLATEQHPCYTLVYICPEPRYLLQVRHNSRSFRWYSYVQHEENYIVLKDIKNFVLQGNSVNGKLSTVVVECIGNGGFAFINITGLQINEISFYRFGHVLPTFAKQLILAHLTVAEWLVETNTALLFTSVHSLALSGMYVHVCFGILGINIFGNFFSNKF